MTNAQKFTAAYNQQNKANTPEINWSFNWGNGGYNSVKAATKKEAMEKATAMGGSILGGVVNLQPDADFKITRASDKACQGMFD